jgi:hypothetical protein
VPDDLGQDGFGPRRQQPADAGAEARSVDVAGGVKLLDELDRPLPVIFAPGLPRITLARLADLPTRYQGVMVRT